MEATAGETAGEAAAAAAAAGGAAGLWLRSRRRPYQFLSHSQQRGPCARGLDRSLDWYARL